ncbi:reverse transcriptase domain-containing protein [Tanacetum coccineum]
MASCNLTRTPVDTKPNLGLDGVHVSDPTLYRSLKGDLQYLIFTRPHISYVVQHACLHMHDPREPRFAVVKRFLCYGPSTKSLCTRTGHSIPELQPIRLKLDLRITLIKMSAMANATPIVTTVTKNANNKKAPDVASSVNILDFCEEHYEDILLIIMEKARRDKRKEVQTRLNFGENPKKTRRERENSLNSRAKNSPTRFHPRISRTRDREKRDDRNVFNRLSHRRKNVHERLSDTYSPSATKFGPSRTDSRDPSHSGGYSLSREHPRIKDRLWGVEESYGDAYSRGTRTKYRDRSRDEDRFRRVKRWRESESPSS